MYFDTHAHLDLEPLCDAEGEVVRRAHEAGVTRIVTIGIGPESSEKAIAIAHRHTGVYASVGLHPHDASACSEPLLARLEELSRCDKVVGIGETGLDFYRDRSPREAQRAAFREQIRLARRRNLPIIVHDRDAHDEILSILAEENAADVGGIIHCFSGDCEMARRAIGMNFLISIPGAITYKGSGTQAEAVRKIPLEKLLIETDCPFLAPLPYRGKTNEPAYVPLVAKKIGEIKGVAGEDVGRVATLSALRIFRIPAEEEVRVSYKIRNSLYLNITNRCTNTCTFCAKRDDYYVKGHYLKLPGEPSVEEVVAEVGDPTEVDEIVFCGFGEPFLRLADVKAIAKTLKGKGAKIRINTDGLANLVHGRNVLPELSGLVDALSVSLNAPDAGTYARICPNRYGAASFPALLDFLREAPRHIPSVVATAVALPDLDHDAVRRLAESIEGVTFRLRPYAEVG
ncbi:MAG: radical SAM protein [Deltaproteobacteria bacterium RBG_19FT_COMBO_60_16]|nr:MAG: radical SAM protein [Deltaproteobacteria bacterium RBG_16_64_85]OGQ00634.1 MAG: radical SAM protein [Deltaproteobacteria bacterium RBG_19FT_COMBO_60_16]